ncbi:Rne/Rng family ribonuclease [Nesterenkonia sp. NBAIMH1]|uniref:Rne/Rng family ribonuclease n=1 Tax=Nesterenkonia sp. NBAIMH1 TaxID=2600320 RepID=UPI0011B4A202
MSNENSTESSAETAEEVYSPFSVPEPGHPGADASPKRPADPEPAEDPLDVLFQAPDLSSVKRTPKKEKEPEPESHDDGGDDEDDSDQESSQQSNADSGGDGGRRSRRKRRRGGRNRGRSADESSQGSDDDSSGGGDRSEQKSDSSDADGSSGSDDEGRAESTDESGTVVRRTRKRRRGSSDMEIEDEDGHTVTRVRSGREASSDASDKVSSVKGSTRLEAKRQRRRGNRQSNRRGIVTEAEFLARRESVDRKMIVRHRDGRIQIGVLEDEVLAEHYVSHTTQDSLIGNVYLGKVQNVLPSMEAAFVDIGRGRNAVLYAGEVDWESAGIGNAPRKIENALKSGDSVLVQVTKDPVGHKGARLTSQVSLPGRYLVFVPGGSMTGISRKLPDTERSRLKKILKENMPQNSGVIVRTAAEGASEEELTNDINRLRALWDSIQDQTNDRKVLAPEMLYAEPDLTIKVVRDVFNEDFSSMEIQDDETWDNVEAYVTYVAPHLLDRLKKWDPAEHDGQDIFAHHRIDEQLNKALGRNVKLPSGGSLVFDRTEAMTVVDVNTGKFTGSGGNLEETVTKNNLEAAEEIVRQLRLRDIGGIIVIDFIDMVLESNRDLVLRRMVECLGRDRTKHQVAEVTSLGLVQMTRKRMGTGLLEVFSSECEHCAGRGIVTHEEPIHHQPAFNSQGEQRSNGSKKSKKRKNKPKKDDDSGRQTDPRELKKLERASAGMAKVAAATAGAGESEKNDEQAPSADTGSSSKNEGQAKSGQSTLKIGGEPVEVPRGEKSGAQKRAEEPAEQPKTSSLDSLEEALASRSEQPRRSAPARRRRRAAGSAQGSGGEVHQVQSAEKEQQSASFSAAAPQKSADEKSAAKADTAPMMLGVGVSADEIGKSE